VEIPTSFPADTKPSLVEALAVWVLYALVLIPVGITYARVPPDMLYAVSGSGAEGGATRALVVLAGPFAPLAAALAVVAAARLRRIFGWFFTAAAAVLCLTPAWPGVMRRHDLDLRWANAPALLGVALAMVLTLVAARARRIGRAAKWRRGDWLRVGLALVLLVWALPWLVAEIGVYPDRVPGLERVHLGHHEGLDGVLLALSVLAVSRAVPLIRRPVGDLLALYLAMILVYGLADAFADGWHEQIVERGWTSWRPPDLLVPHASPAWAALVLCAVSVAPLLRR
jgi:hypothetical protein